MSARKRNQKEQRLARALGDAEGISYTAALARVRNGDGADGRSILTGPAYEGQDLTIYVQIEPKLRRLPKRRLVTEADILKPAFRLERAGPLEIYYAPMDWLRPTARLAIVGITPGKGTMVIAHQTVATGLAAGKSPATVLNDVKSRAAFSGMRTQLADWLEYLGVHSRLGLPSAHDLWTTAGERYLQPTSAIRYPALANGANYGGSSPAITKSPLLRGYLLDVLAPELARIPDALVVPLGRRVDEAIALLVADGKIDPARCLIGFPHASGNNGHRTRQWEDNRSTLKRRVTAWFRAHPAV